MISGVRKEKLMEYEEILKLTSGGYDIYMFYEGEVKKKMKCPWRKDDNPSFGIFPKDGVWLWKDLAKEEVGTAVDYVMNKFGLTFRDAIRKIMGDFGWSTNTVNAKPAFVNWENKDIKPTIISVSSRPFTKKHHEFWNCAGVSEKDCNKYNCYAVKDLAINRKYLRLNKDEIAFFYEDIINHKYKIYLPERTKDRRFLNNVDYFHLWNEENVNKCNKLIVQKSMKDLIVTCMITPNVIATQAEATKIFNDSIVQRINDKAEEVWVWYGSDMDGVEKCKNITNSFNWRYINTPSNLLPYINDTYSMSKNLGLKSVEQFMISKGLL